MIASGLRKLARENGMKVSGGVAYGSLRGFAATLSEGAGYKKIDFAAVIPEKAGRDLLSQRLAAENVRAGYRVQNISFGERVIQVTFHDTMGTMKKIRSFLDFFIPLLEESGATRADTCAECGAQLTVPLWVQVNGVCHPMHGSCARQVEQALSGENTQVEKPAGNYWKGALGALIAAILGAVMWAVILNAGYVAALVGMVIGMMTERGYRIAGGREGKGKIWVLILSVALSVVLGTFGSDAIEIGKLLLAGSLPGFGFGEIPMFILALLVDNADYRRNVLVNLLKGLLYAALGAFLVLRQSAHSAASGRFRYMK